MRVVVVSKALVAETYRRKLEALAQLGVDVIAVVPPAWREGGEQRLEPGEGERYPLLVSPMRWNGRFHLHYYPALPRLIRWLRPDLVHMDEEPYNIATFHGVIAARRAGARAVFFTWQNIVRRYPPPFSWLERANYGMTAAAVAGSDTAARILRAKGYRNPISVVPQFGVDVDLFHPGPTAERPFTVGMFNRLVPAKAPLEAIEAFNFLPPETRMLIVGDGPLRLEVERAVRNHGLEGRVTLRRRVASSAMPGLMRSVDVAILSSRTTPRWKEQFGRVLIEAMASGVPVIGSDSGEIPSVVGDAGLIVSEGDIPALATALRSLCDDLSLRCSLAERGRRRALDLYSNERVARATLDAYQTALK